MDQTAVLYKELIQILRDHRIPWDKIPKWERINEHLGDLRTIGVEKLKNK